MTDLGDFGGGIDKDDSPEEQVKVELSQWLNNRNVKVYWEKKHDDTHSHSTFRVEGTRRKPDLLVDSPGANYALEVKTAEDSSKVHDGCLETYEYWEDIVEDRCEYKLGGNSLNIEAVLLATGYSKKGKLFNDEGNTDPLRTDSGEGRQRAVESGQLPENEHTASETAIRMIWRFSKRHDSEANVGLGALLSSRLDGDSVDMASPYALYKVNGGVNETGSRAQEWAPIPFYLED